MSFALFWLGEYANVLLMCALNAVLFFGGWLPPIEWAPLYWIPGWLWLFAKIFFFFFIFSWVKATVPRYRYDQLMRLGWKIFLPLSLAFVVLVSGYLMLTRFAGPNDLALANPTRHTLQAMNASDVCRLFPADQHGIGADSAAKMVVYLDRTRHAAVSGDVFDVRYPTQLAGTFTFRQTANNGNGGSGPLFRSGKSGTAELAWSAYDSGSSGSLWYRNGNQVLMGDCKQAFELRA
jgi:hypothetical protein